MMSLQYLSTFCINEDLFLMCCDGYFSFMPPSLVGISEGNYVYVFRLHSCLENLVRHCFRMQWREYHQPLVDDVVEVEGLRSRLLQGQMCKTSGSRIF